MNKRVNICLISVLIITAVFLAACGSNSGDASSPLRESKASAPQLLEPENHAGGIGWQKTNCISCHPDAQLEDIHEYSSMLSASFAKISSTETGACLYCHGSNGIENITAETYDCMLCHENREIVPWYELFSHKNKHDFNGNDKMDSSDCVTCHAFSDMNGKIDAAIDFSKSGSPYATTTDFCLNCHDGNGAFGIMPSALDFEKDSTNIYSTFMGTGETTDTQKLTADIHGVKDGYGQSFGEFRGSYTNSMTVPCLACHLAHSSDNPYLITESGKTAELTDADAMAASVSVTENNYTQLCAVCHKSDDGALTENGLLEVVHNSTFSSNCSDCHYHGSGFGTDNSNLY
ncbi:MAG: hypothetical protein C0602_00400 [Denitrovibrio sp.]|nr:MAG: hypothetical protein C0602_00400 [Denitrovibrio sp.]